MHCTTYKTAFLNDVWKNGFLMINPSNRTLIGSLRIEQKPIEQRLTHKMMATRLLLVVNSQIILEGNIG